MTRTIKPALDYEEHLGNYIILEKIDQSYWFTAYSAVEPALNRHAAIKVIHGPYSGEQKNVLAFKDLARRLGDLNHPNIVPLYTIGNDKDFFYYATGYVGAYNLRDWLFNDRPFDTKTAQRILLPLISALEFGAKEKIYHLDFRPRTVLFSLEDKLYLANLGLLQSRNHLIGNEVYDCLAQPYYVTPEQISGKPVDHRTDIYSVGAAFFHLMTGHPPYEGATNDQICRAHLVTPFPRAKAIESDLPQPWIDLLEKMMAKEPKDRFQTYEELATTVEKLPID